MINAVLTIALLFILSIPSTTFAKITLLGEQETVRKIQAIDLKGPKGENLYMGYKVTKSFLLLGISVQDDGYVIGVEGHDDLYYPMIQGRELSQLQTLKLLPDPFPAYQLDTMDYLIGYSFWIALLIAGFYYALRYLIRKH